jgi:anti-sigma factor RsiW
MNLIQPRAAVAATGAFALGCLVTQLVTVPSWQRAGTPEASLRSFRRSGPATGAALFPTEVLAVGLLARLTADAVRNQRPEAAWWAPATVGMLGTLVLLPVFFVSTNRALLDADCPPSAVPDLVAAWKRWNWVRFGFALGATLFAGRAAALTRT